MEIEKINKVLDSLKVGQDFENVHNQIIDKCKDALLKADENSGWTRIEADGSNLPTPDKEFKRYKMGFLDNGSFKEVGFETTYWDTVGHYFDAKEITHYRPIEKSKSPLI